MPDELEVRGKKMVAADNPRRVLVVEDEAFIRLVLAAALEDEGFEVMTAANGREALGVLKQWQPDLIILDLWMPWMDGPTFLARQRSTREIADIPVIVLSANAAQIAQSETLQADAVLEKPFDLDILLKTADQLIQGRAVSAAR